MTDPTAQETLALRRIRERNAPDAIEAEMKLQRDALANGWILFFQSPQEPNPKGGA